MKKNILIIIILFLNLASFGQKKEEFKEISVHFIIKLYSVSTQKFADSMKASDSKIERKWDGDVPPLTPQPPEIAIFDIQNSAIYFIIMPKHYTKYTVPNDFESDSTATYGVLDVIKIDRDNIKIKNIISQSFKEVASRFSDKEFYNLLYKIGNTSKSFVPNISLYNKILQNNQIDLIQSEALQMKITDLYEV